MLLFLAAYMPARHSVDGQPADKPFEVGCDVAGEADWFDP
jgi:hypothetical protein